MTAMKWSIMTDGDLIAAVADCDVDYYKSVDWCKVGPDFYDYNQAQQHADKLASIV
jgi:hypothetical protein